MILSFPILNTQPEKRDLIQLINDILFANIDLQIFQHIYHCISVVCS